MRCTIAASLQMSDEPKNFGKLVADKGYISQSLFEELFVDDIHLITRIRKNMKNSLMHLRDKILLRKRSLIETVNDELENIVQIEHTRHRSIGGFAANLMAAMAAYSFLPKKPSLNIEIIEREILLSAKSLDSENMVFRSPLNRLIHCTSSKVSPLSILRKHIFSGQPLYTMIRSSEINRLSHIQSLSGA